MRQACRLCTRDALTPIIDIGPQPIANRFRTAPDDVEDCFPIALVQCAACGLVQIDESVPPGALVPPFEWITYNEPEGHLDQLVDVIMKLPGIGPGATAAGVSFKDDSALARLERRGLRRWRVDLRDDLGVAGAHAGCGVETVQARLTPAAADATAARHGRADVVIARQVLEHANSPRDFIDALRRLASPSGYLVVEVPDCMRALDRCDYVMIWEEHTLYYTPATFRTGFESVGLEVVRTENYPYPSENSLVAIVKANGGAPQALPVAADQTEQARARRFGEQFPQYRERVRAFLRTHRRQGGKIALFGGGHSAVTFVSVFDVEDDLDCVVDDNPHKLGMYMPGTRLQIVGSPALLERGITLCLLGLNPASEEKVVRGNAAFVQRGGLFASISPASAYAAGW